MNFYSSNFVVWDILNGSPCTKILKADTIVSAAIILQLLLVNAITALCEDIKNIVFKIKM